MKSAFASRGGYVHKHARISTDGKYRYLLEREWRLSQVGILGARWRMFGEKDGAGKEMGEPKACVFIMLNPSTADADKDDPTIRKCVKFAKAWKYDLLQVVNLFAYRATDPKKLLALPHTEDPVGVLNQEVIERVVHDAGVVVCAWGAHGGHLGQHQTVLGWIQPRKTYCLGLTKEGHPRHPLYVRDDKLLEPYNGDLI